MCGVVASVFLPPLLHHLRLDETERRAEVFPFRLILQQLPRFAERLEGLLRTRVCALVRMYEQRYLSVFFVNVLFARIEAHAEVLVWVELEARENAIHLRIATHVIYVAEEGLEQHVAIRSSFPFVCICDRARCCCRCSASHITCGAGSGGRCGGVIACW